MAYHFSANQFEDQYSPRKLGNWEYPKWYPDRPRQRFKSTKIIADDCGRLLEGIKRENAWGNYVGTWDFPRRITRDYIKKLVAPPEKSLKVWGKKKKEPEEQFDTQSQKSVSQKSINEKPIEKEEEKIENAHSMHMQGERCKMCGRLISECTCQKSCHSDDAEVCDDTLYCPKCNRELCICEDYCRCPT